MADNGYWVTRDTEIDKCRLLKEVYASLPLSEWKTISTATRIATKCGDAEWPELKKRIQKELEAYNEEKQRCKCRCTIS